MKHSAPTWVTRFYVRHFIKILIATCFLYYVMVRWAFDHNYMNVDKIKPEDFYLGNEAATEEFEVAVQLGKVRNFAYVEAMDKHLKELKGLDALGDYEVREMPANFDPF